MRNLITKKHGDKTKTQIGYKKEIIDRNEGEIWEENGKKWTIKNGLKVSISKLDGFKKLFQLPLLCPSCNNPMNSKLDKKFYTHHKQCFNCVIEMEQKLRIEGKWEEYEQHYIKTSAEHVLSELEKEFEEFLNSNDTFVTEQGDVEEWGGEMNKEKMREEMKKYIESIKSQLNI